MARGTKNSLKFLLRDFAEWTTIPGPIQIVYALNSLFRMLWVVIWLGLFGVFVYQVFLIVQKVITFPSEIRVSVNFMSRRFPVVTICNQNPYKYDVIRSNPNFSDIAVLMNDYQRMVASRYGDISDDHFGFNIVNTRLQKEMWAQKALILLANQIPEEIRRQATYSFEEFFRFCYFNNVPCMGANFTSYLDATYGTCYQFNVPNTTDFQTYRAGSLFGLRTLLLPKQVDPGGNRIYLPTTTLSGVVIRVEHQDKDPAMDSFGLNCPVGREVMVTMELAETTLMKKPYGQCVDNIKGSFNYYPNKVYTLQTCLRSCRQNRAINFCDCADPRYNKPDNISYCDVTQIQCLFGLESQSVNNTFSPIRDCGCHPPCEEYNIITLISQATFPANSFNVLNGPGLDYKYSCGNPNSFFGGDKKRCIQWYKQNSLVLNIWYDGLDFESNDQTPTYTITQASNDLGGQMGVWLGVSVISVIEFIALLIMVCLYIAYGRRVQINPTPQELNQDVRYRNIQQLKEELNKHEIIDKRVKEQIDKANRDAEVRRVELQCQIGHAKEMAERANGQYQSAQTAALGGGAKEKAALANAKAIANCTNRHLQQLQDRLNEL
ncbi:amiloride-sensitive sodium channel domain-containing protein [Ditylenchus destructor]|uniref:Amiloride-sensitive sodium channel domain-containing protein n=1 Tax=Ditylenchus destructor TaxID=166010 RepID=A0AAD4N040_9BILA|nr:amiloride-sensitive sodium channel domain-containing protein [Ditylenchus destructor]